MWCRFASGPARGAVGFYDDEDDTESDPSEESDSPELDPAEENDLEFEELPCTDDDDSRWEAFIPDDDERDPEPEAGDFWIVTSRESRVESREPDGY